MATRKPATHPRFLVVDDHPVVCVGVRALLRETWPQARIVEACTLADALREATEAHFDLVILDLGLPDGVGVEAIHAFRQQHPRCPVVVFSRGPEHKFGLLALRAGAMGYVSKDSSMDTLLNAVRRALNGNRYISEVVGEQLAASSIDGEQPLHDKRLSPREERVLLLLGAGVSPSEIARSMNLSIKTISTYRARLMAKLELGNNADIVRYCISNQLLE